MEEILKELSNMIEFKNKIFDYNKNTIEEFEIQKKKIIEKIDLELAKYKKKAEIDALELQKNAYEKMAEKAKVEIEQTNQDINEGKNVDIFRLNAIKSELEVTSQRMDALNTEIKGYKILEENEESFENLRILKNRVQEMFTLNKNNVDRKITRIFMDEENDRMQIFIKDKFGRECTLERKGEIEQLLNNKKDIFNNNNIYIKCERIAGSKFKGFLLRRKVNPVIIALMGALDDKQSIESYLNAIQTKQEVDFEMVHDLTNSKLSFTNKALMKRVAKVEEKDLGIRVYKKDNKFKLLPSKSKKTVKNQPKKFNLGRFTKSKSNKEKFNEQIKVELEKNEMGKVVRKLKKDVNEIIRDEEIR